MSYVPIDGYHLVDGYVLTWSSSTQKFESELSSGGGFTAGGDLSGTSSSQTVVSLTGSSNLVNIPSPTVLEFGSHSIAAQSGLIRFGDVQGSGGSPASTLIAGRNHANTADYSIISTDGFGDIYFGNVGFGLVEVGGAGISNTALSCTAGNFQVNGSSNALISFVIPAFKTLSVSGAFTFDSDASLTDWLFKVNGTSIIDLSASVVSLTTNKTTWGATGQQLESDLPTPTTTSNNTPTTAFTYAMADNTVLKMDVLVIARDTTTGTSAATFNLSASYYRSGGAPVAIGTTTSSDPKGTNAGSPPSGWAATIATSTNNIIVQVTGDVSDSVKWMVIPQIQTVS